MRLAKKISIIFFLIIILSFITIAAIRKYRYLNYSYLQPKIGPVVEAVYGLGSVKSDRIYNLKIGISSMITRKYVQEGFAVNKNAKLISTDDYVTFRSPFAGTITKINFNEREVVAPGQIILTIVDLTKNYIQVFLNQESVLLVKKAQEAEISFENLRKIKIKGHVGSVYSSEGSFIVRIDTEELPKCIIPGMTCDVAIKVNEKKDILLVPLKAVEYGKIKIIRNKKRRLMDVTIGIETEKWGEVVSGNILADDLIIVRKEKR